MTAAAYCCFVASTWAVACWVTALNSRSNSFSYERILKKFLYFFVSIIDRRLGLGISSIRVHLLGLRLIDSCLLVLLGVGPVQRGGESLASFVFERLCFLFANGFKIVGRLPSVHCKPLVSFLAGRKIDVAAINLATPIRFGRPTGTSDLALGQMIIAGRKIAGRQIVAAWSWVRERHRLITLRRFVPGQSIKLFVFAAHDVPFC